MPAKLLSEPEGYDLLQDNGIPVPDHVLVQSAEEAAAYSQDIGYPVVMKIVSPQIIHKSDAGGVIIDINSPDEAMTAFNAILASARAYDPNATINGVIVERQMPAGLELIIGGKTDPAFGKVITFGLGGTLVELFRDVTIRVLPIDRDEIRRMVREIRGYRLIEGYRGRNRLDEETLVNLLDAAITLFSNTPQMREFDINPMILYEKGAYAVDARIYMEDGDVTGRKPERGSFSPELFYPGSIAVVGASSDPRKIGYSVFRNLLSFPGKLFPVNPKRAEVLGCTTYPSIAVIPDHVDVVVIAVPAELVPQVMEESGEKGVRLAVIISAGFRESGRSGEVLERKVGEIARRYGMRVVGPNSLGLMMPHQGINTTFDPISPQPGSIGFISQSGAIITTIVDWSIPQRVGFSTVVSVGNQLDLNFIDYLTLVEQNPDTKAIILYIEEIKDGSRFMETVKGVAAKKPVVAVKSGASRKGMQAAASHTGSLAGSYEIYMAAFKQAGVIAVHSLNEAFDVAGLLASEGYPKGERAVVVTGAGGFAVLASDYAEWNGVELPGLSDQIRDELNEFLPPNWSRDNPIDIIGDAGADRYARVFNVLIRHQEAWDIAFVIATPTAVLNPTHLAQEIVRFSKNTSKMVVGCVLGGDSMKSASNILKEKGIPNFQDLQDAFRAVGRSLRGVREWEVPRPAEAPPFSPVLEEPG
jgi:acetyl coenzyme A synthetase (ADP forming)-like protein